MRDLRNSSAKHLAPRAALATPRAALAPARAALVASLAVLAACSGSGARQRAEEVVETLVIPGPRCVINDVGFMTDRGSGPFLMVPTADWVWTVEGLSGRIAVSRLRPNSPPEADLASLVGDDGPLVPMAAASDADGLLVIAAGPDLRRPTAFRVAVTGEVTRLTLNTRIDSLGQRFFAFAHTGEDGAAQVQLIAANPRRHYSARVAGSALELTEAPIEPNDWELVNLMGEDLVAATEGEDGTRSLRVVNPDGKLSDVGLDYRPDGIVQSLSLFEVHSGRAYSWVEHTADSVFRLATAIERPAPDDGEFIVRFRDLTNAPVELESFEFAGAPFVVVHPPSSASLLYIYDLSAPSEPAGTLQIPQARSDTLQIQSALGQLWVGWRRGRDAASSLAVGTMACEPVAANR